MHAASAAFAIHLWTDMDLKLLFNYRLDRIKQMFKLNDTFCDAINKNRHLEGDDRLEIGKVNKILARLSHIGRQDNWTDFGEEICEVGSGYLIGVEYMTGFVAASKLMKSSLFRAELMQINKELTEYNAKGSAHYRAKQFKESIGQFTKALEVAKICFVAGDKKLVQCYYNLGAAYHQINELSKATDALLIAQKLGKKNTKMDSLLHKISNRLEQIAIQ